MLSIYKYKIKEGIVEAPVINWLNIEWQDKEQGFVAWALVDLDAPARFFKVKCIETGYKFAPEEIIGYEYINTINFNLYVLHFFIAEIDENGKIKVKEDLKYGTKEE